MTPPCQFCEPHERQGAERERRRIRRAQRYALIHIDIMLKSLGSQWADGSARLRIVRDTIAAATKAPKKGKRK